jgi:hypothetical protein
MGMSPELWNDIVYSPEYDRGFHDGWTDCLQWIAKNNQQSRGAYDRYVEVMERDLSPAEKSTLLCDLDEGALLRVVALRLEELRKSLEGGE